MPFAGIAAIGDCGTPSRRTCELHHSYQKDIGGHVLAWAPTDVSNFSTIVGCDDEDDSFALVAARWTAPTSGENDRTPPVLSLWRDSGPNGIRALSGDFSFAVFDGRNCELVLGLAPLSAMQLFYRRLHDGKIAFGSNPAWLAGLEGSAPAMDMDACAAMLQMRAMVDDTRTAFLDVVRVQPGTVVVGRGDELRAVRFWDPTAILRTDRRKEKAATQLRECLEQSVGAILDSSPGRIGCQLSAGRDSSAVMAVTARQLQSRGQTLDAYTAANVQGGEVYPGYLIDEAPLAGITARRYPNVRHQVLRPVRLKLSDALDVIHRAVGSPILRPTSLSWHLTMLDRCRADVVVTLLEGGMGNYALSAGGRVLLHDQRIEDGWISWTTTVAHQWNQSPKALAKTLLTGIGPRRRRRLSATRPDILNFINGPLKQQYLKQPAADDEAMSYRGWLNAGLRNVSRPFAIGKVTHGIELIDPTADRRLVDLVVGLPSRLLACRDDRREMFELAFGDLLPPEVLRTNSRGLQNADWHLSFDVEDLGQALVRYGQSSRVREMIDISALQQCLAGWPDRRTLFNPVHRRFVDGFLPAFSLASFLYTIEN